MVCLLCDTFLVASLQFVHLSTPLFKHRSHRLRYKPPIYLPDFSVPVFRFIEIAFCSFFQVYKGIFLPVAILTPNFERRMITRSIEIHCMVYIF